MRADASVEDQSSLVLICWQSDKLRRRNAQQLNRAGNGLDNGGTAPRHSGQ
jgi:hypothetical protein